MERLKEEGDYSIYLWFCFLGVRRIKHGLVFDEELESLSSRLAKEWRPLALRLRFTGAEIVAIDKENEQHSEKVYMMLMRWKEREGSHATYQVLHDALIHEFVQRKDLAEIFCIVDEFLVST